MSVCVTAAIVRIGAVEIPFTFEALEAIGAEVPDPSWSEDNLADRLFEQEIYRCLPQIYR